MELEASLGYMRLCLKGKEGVQQDSSVSKDICYQDLLRPDHWDPQKTTRTQGSNVNAKTLHFFKFKLSLDSHPPNSRLGEAVLGEGGDVF